jgi:hypothetical protein
MATGDDTLFRPRPKSTLVSDIKPAAVRGPAAAKEPEFLAETPEGDQIVALPQPGDPYETAHSRPGNKPVPTLRFIMGDTVRGLPYASLDSIDLLPGDKPGDGPKIVILFTGLVPRKAVITGRQLLMLFDLLSYHRVAWVRELPKEKDFRNHPETVVTGITVERITAMPE